MIVYQKPPYVDRTEAVLIYIEIAVRTIHDRFCEKLEMEAGRLKRKEASAWKRKVALDDEDDEEDIGGSPNATGEGGKEEVQKVKAPNPSAVRNAAGCGCKIPCDDTKGD